MDNFDYVFSENGLVAYKGGELLAMQVGAGALARQGPAGLAMCAGVRLRARCSATCDAPARHVHPPGLPTQLPRAPQSLSGHLGEANLKEFINFCLKYLAGGCGLLVVLWLPAPAALAPLCAAAGCCRLPRRRTAAGRRPSTPPALPPAPPF